MSLMDWSSDLQLDVNSMDSQHKGLLDIMNKLYDDYQKGADFAILSTSLNQLAEKTVKHFSDEEAYMESIDFPNLGTHKVIHKDLLEKFGAHKEKFEQEKQLNDEFFNFLKFWLRSHIMGIDTKYAQHSKSKVA